MKTNILIFLFVAIIPFCVIDAAGNCDAPKYAQKMSKHLQEQGWRPFSDDACIAEQVANRDKLLMEYDDDLYPKHVAVEGTSDICSSMDEAYKKAVAIAQLNLIVSVSTVEVHGHTEASASETQMSTDLMSTYYTSFEGYTWETRSIIRSDVQIDSTTVCYNGIKLMETYQNGEDAGEKFYWDAMLKYCDVLPIARKAMVVFRLYRKTNKGYEVSVSLCHVPYFSEYAKPIVEKTINEWQAKGEFEKVADWQKRVNETTRNAKIKELTKQCEANYIAKYSPTAIPQFKLDGQYDSENEAFLLSDPLFGNIIVPVPIAEAPIFKKNWLSVKQTPKYFIENDVLSIASMDMYFPTLNKHYTYSNQASAKYEQALVDYDFEPIDIAKGSSSAPKGQQIIGEKKISVGKSEVDTKIPETNAKSENTFVIILANEDYKNVAKVPFALNDGRVFAKYCQRTLGIPAANIKVHENSTYNDMRLALAWLKNVCEKYEGEASVIFYYAGHGIPDASDKSAYLLPVDGDGRYVATGYKLDELYEKLGTMPTKSITVILDACFSGANRDGKMLASERGVALKSRPGAPQGNMVVFSAAQGDETALPNEDEGHGMFTYYLLKKLQETQGNITLKDLSAYVIREVGKKSAVSNKPQTPSITPSSSVADTWQTWKLK